MKKTFSLHLYIIQKSLQLAFFFFLSTAFGQTDDFFRQKIYDLLHRKRMTNIEPTSFDTLKVFLKKIVP